MNIEKISFQPCGYIFCHSNFYSVDDVLSGTERYDFSKGINMLLGDIDSGHWAVSYLLSMYVNKKKSEKNFLSSPESVMINDNYNMSLEEICRYSCYMDECYPLFQTKTSVKESVERAIKNHQLDITAENIRELFHMDKERFCRPISGTGNERFRAMSAIGYVNGKKVFCFPWLSEKRFSAYRGHMTDLFNILEQLGMIVIVPKGKK